MTRSENMLSLSWLAKKKEPMPANARTVKAFLAREGASTANSIKNTVGMAHTDVYRALVWLEARGLAFLHIRHVGRQCIGGYWEAA